MGKAGGIITLIAGIFGFLAAIITLFFGGVASALDSGDEVLLLGWGGLLGAFAIIVLGALGMGAKTKKIGISILVVSIATAIFGGTFVAVCMLLSFVGGVLVTFGTVKEEKVTE